MNPRSSLLLDDAIAAMVGGAAAIRPRDVWRRPQADGAMAQSPSFKATLDAWECARARAEKSARRLVWC